MHVVEEKDGYYMECRWSEQQGVSDLHQVPIVSVIFIEWNWYIKICAVTK